MNLKACWVIVEKTNNVAEAKRNLTAKKRVYESRADKDLEPPNKKPRLSIVLARNANNTWRIVEKPQREDDVHDRSDDSSWTTSPSSSCTPTSSIEEEVLKVRYGVTVKNNKPVIGQAYDVKSTMKKPAEMDPRMKLASKLEIKNSSDILKFLFRPSEDESSSGYSSKSG
ncbi:hypothetical protein TSAR_009426 [Trichomalopsis sarcophagae]|uniref:Uncharacterized protein n=1 Tax=Trichomalopsis sarcophagae TaxID=543379 RepID=A0A232FKC5_9HYME|nr:hypothetical protein TSAR_009426 [Trichomalopsis sarcophagae]